MPPLPIMSIPLAWILRNRHHLNFAACVSQSQTLLQCHPSFIWEAHTRIKVKYVCVGGIFLPNFPKWFSGILTLVVGMKHRANSL